MNPTTAWINDQILIPDLLRIAPQARPVLDRYGLRGCGGPLSPVESLGFFARAHDVPANRLLAEIRQTVEQPAPPAPPDDAPSADRGADTLYRPFFRAGIAVVLTLGAVWGAYLLLRIAWLGSFAAAGLHEVNAHGHAQIFGWVGLFVMGFAYQAFSPLQAHLPGLDWGGAGQFQPLADPLLRRTLARTVTIAAACRLLGQDPRSLVDALNAAGKRSESRCLSLPVLTGDMPAGHHPGINRGTILSN